MYCISRKAKWLFATSCIPILKKNTCLLSHQTVFWENQDGLSSTGSGDDGGSLQFKNITTKVLQCYHILDPRGMASTLVRTLEGAFYGSFHDGVKTQDMKALMLAARVSIMVEFSYDIDIDQALQF